MLGVPRSPRTTVAVAVTLSASQSAPCHLWSSSCSASRNYWQRRAATWFFFYSTTGSCSIAGECNSKATTEHDLRVVSLELAGPLSLGIVVTQVWSPRPGARRHGGAVASHTAPSHILVQSVEWSLQFRVDRMTHRGRRHLPQASITYSAESLTVVAQFDGHCKHRLLRLYGDQFKLAFSDASRSCWYLELTLILHEGTTKSCASTMYCAY
ncbi:hypothetical protein EDD16DRAFT_931056 [Pisolithus croceorrhizus]|nr:hypothetical protein EDD16DRAFT_931056 [Pisolithus croceorrhizus]KAI6164411.1 hypothetical protein EDD17DRAFT_345400 [Pisolithus thermaeus]